MTRIKLIIFALVAAFTGLNFMMGALWPFFLTLAMAPDWRIAAVVFSAVQGAVIMTFYATVVAKVWQQVKNESLNGPDQSL